MRVVAEMGQVDGDRVKVLHVRSDQEVQAVSEGAAVRGVAHGGQGPSTVCGGVPDPCGPGTRRVKRAARSIQPSWEGYLGPVLCRVAKLTVRTGVGYGDGQAPAGVAAGCVQSRDESRGGAVDMLEEGALAVPGEVG